MAMRGILVAVACAVVLLLLAYPSSGKASDSDETVSEEKSAPIETKNWARGAAAFGISASVLMETAWILADTFRINHEKPALKNPSIWPAPVIPAAILTIIGPPIIAAGSASARRDYLVDGLPKVRIAGWVSYSLAAAFSVVMTVISAMSYTCCLIDMPVLIMPCIGSLGALSAILMSVDSLASHRQSLEVMGKGTPSHERGRLSLIPVFFSHRTSVLVGLGGTF